MHSGSFGLAGKVAIVTGGSRGIGRAVVDLLASFQTRVVVNYVRDEDAAAATVALARERGAEAIAIRGDVSQLAEADRLVNETLERFGRIDFLICNAGIWKGGPVETISEELWDKTFDINLKGTWSVCRAAVPVMKQQKFGRIVIVSSTAGQRGEANVSNYAASKGGQISFTKSLSTELAPFGINVNCVAPGWVETEMTADVVADKQQLEAVNRTIPKGRMARPEEIAGPIVFLCSEWAEHITGEILNVNGGSVLCG
ncbi:MAG TPA: 3-oxoacyl-ACP reductase family protein [Pyrinomonadaceae bacterium]|nr:3-oxoacyl-ACP reductase family protein [Pyrinomonadaceae bacterium]